MNKIIREVLALLWKAFKLVFWKWLRPMLGRLLMWGVLLAGLIVLAIVLASR
ncbi:MAG TPA: hypothetical protein VHB21_20930 [Minicystis sp.]|nr:hypothetical protein [Minicystis sp.]